MTTKKKLEVLYLFSVLLPLMIIQIFTANRIDIVLALTMFPWWLPILFVWLTFKDAEWDYQLAGRPWPTRWGWMSVVTIHLASLFVAFSVLVYTIAMPSGLAGYVAFISLVAAFPIAHGCFHFVLRVLYAVLRSTKWFRRTLVY